MRIKIGRRTWLAALPGALALLCLFLWLPGAASALTLEKTISSGKCIAVLDMDVSAHGTVSNQIVVTTLNDATRYDIVYAAGKAEKPTARFYLRGRNSFTSEPTTALIQTTDRPNQGLLVWIEVISGSVQLSISSSDSQVRLTPVRTTTSPLHFQQVSKGKVINMKIGNASFSSIPAVLCGTIGTQIKRQLGSDKYELYKFTGPKLIKYTYIDGIKKAETDYPYESTISSGDWQFFCSYIPFELSPVSTSGAFMTKLGRGGFAFPAGWLDYQWNYTVFDTWDHEENSWYSENAGFEYTIQDWDATNLNETIAATPVISPEGGVYEEPLTVTISCATDGAQIHYTTDGSEPTAASPVYSGPIPVDETMTISAVAMKEGLYNSSVTVSIYDFEGPVSEEISSGLAGSGTEADPYLISSAADWNYLANYVNNFESDQRAAVVDCGYLLLTRNITVSTMVGRMSNDSSITTRKFTGHFDGGGHTLTFRHTATADYCAPFGYVINSTIENLHVTGSIYIDSSEYDNIAGVCARAERSRIINCVSSIQIDTVLYKSDYLCGIAAYAPHTEIIGCVFDGSITGNGSSNSGFARTSATCRDCVFDAAELQGRSDMTNFSKYGDDITNCYYTWSLDGGTNQGNYALAVTGDGSADLDFGEGTVYDVSGITAYPTGLKYGDTFYAGAGEEVALGLHCEAPEGFRAVYTASAGTLTETDGGWTLTMPEEGDVTISASVIPALGSGTQADPWRITAGMPLTSMRSGWYEVTGSVVCSERIAVSGNVDLILGAGASLTALQGINVSTGNSLTISGSGTLNAIGCRGCAGIGGGIDESCGAVTINSGTVNATGSVWGAGIGGGKGGGNGGNITINGGNVTAQCYDPDNAEVGLAAGIGGGDTGSGGMILITGGTVYARGNRGSAGIGGGGYGSGGTITITGGTVTAVGASYPNGRSGAGIGAGRVRNSATSGDSGNITITGGTVVAVGGDNAQAIGLSSEVAANDSGTLTLGDGLRVTAGSSESTAVVAAGNLVTACRSAWVKIEVGETVPPFGEPDFTLPTGLSEIGEEAFEGIAAMTVIVIPDSCRAIGDHAFRDCTNLYQVRIPADCAIGTDAFDGCTTVYIYGTAGSPAHAYCQDPQHANCVFVSETQN
ncbi:MAG: chitobiase/beta-hexosaminidase C-terminal domain-containing protein [Clostridia bacterium]|nr:chitobiase/beta-hexosaminidase C-terminal domain-containing protein [Clostridia bacterium]